MSDYPSLYLILHRVRGESAFDVAQKATYGSEEGWCIGTSGHRAYPYRWWNLDDLADISDVNDYGHPQYPARWENRLPPDWPDHYAINDTHRKSAAIRMKKKLDALSDTELEAILALIQSEAEL